MVGCAPVPHRPSKHREGEPVDLEEDDPRHVGAWQDALTSRDSPDHPQRVVIVVVRPQHDLERDRHSGHHERGQQGASEGVNRPARGQEVVRQNQGRRHRPPTRAGSRARGCRAASGLPPAAGRTALRGAPPPPRPETPSPGARTRSRDDPAARDGRRRPCDHSRAESQPGQPGRGVQASAGSRFRMRVSTDQPRSSELGPRAWPDSSQPLERAATPLSRSQPREQTGGGRMRDGLRAR